VVDSHTSGHRPSWDSGGFTFGSLIRRHEPASSSRRLSESTDFSSISVMPVPCSAAAWAVSSVMAMIARGRDRELPQDDRGPARPEVGVEENHARAPVGGDGDRVHDRARDVALASGPLDPLQQGASGTSSVDDEHPARVSNCRVSSPATIPPQVDIVRLAS
jgi:hypothetical protein